MKKIALIECWFGPFPTWHDFYLRTCAANEDIDWIIFHDRPSPAQKAPNIRFIQMTKSELERRASSLLGATITLTNGFKGTDLRASFGSLFQDVLTPYEFWGYNDSDVFWGRIREFITDDVLDRHDVITSCRASVVGQFTLFRNSGPTREMFRLIPNYLSILLQPGPGHLDEGAVDAAAVAANLRVYRRQLQVHDANAPDWEQKARSMELADKGHLKDWFWEEGPCRWQDGRVIHLGTGKETMFIHFKLWKIDWRKHCRVPRLRYHDRLLNGFTISRHGLRLHFKLIALPLAPIYLAWHHTPLRLTALWRFCTAFTSRITHAVKRRL